jgi:hypothetical protein
MTDNMREQLLAAKHQAIIIHTALDGLIDDDTSVDTGDLRAMTDPLLEILIFTRQLERMADQALDLAIGERGVARLKDKLEAPHG